MGINKLYVLTKYVIAKNPSDAIKKEKKYEVDAVWLQEDFVKSLTSQLAEDLAPKKRVGFKGKK